FLNGPGSPCGKPVPKLVSFGDVDTASKRCDLLVWMPAPHPDDDRSRQNRVGQPAQARQGHGAVSRDLLDLDRLAVHRASPDHGSAPMASIQEGADLFILFGFRSKDRVDFVE